MRDGVTVLEVFDVEVAKRGGSGEEGEGVSELLSTG